MTHDDFDHLLQRRLELMRIVLSKKAVEYSTEDRLHNFKRSALITGETPAQVCVGFFVKHLTSVLDIVDKDAAGQKTPSLVLDEKIGDAMNYLLLLEALLQEG